MIDASLGIRQVGGREVGQCGAILHSTGKHNSCLGEEIIALCEQLTFTQIGGHVGLR